MVGLGCYVKVDGLFMMNEPSLLSIPAFSADYAVARAVTESVWTLYEAMKTV